MFQFFKEKKIVISLFIFGWKKSPTSDIFFFCFSSFSQAGSPLQGRNLHSPRLHYYFFFSVGTRNYQFYFVQRRPRSFLTYLGDSLCFLSLLQILLVKAGNKVYCGHKRPAGLMNKRLHVMSTAILQKPVVLYNWCGKHSHELLETKLLRSRMGRSFYLSSA